MIDEKDDFDEKSKEVSESIGAALECLPALRDASDRSKAVLCLRSMGMSYLAIARQLGISKRTAFEIAKKHDPEGKLKMPLEMRQNLIKERLTSIAMEVLHTIKPEDLLNMGPKDLMILAKDSLTAAKMVSHKPTKRTEKIDDVLSRARPVTEE